MRARSALGRGALLFGFWVVLIGVGALDAVVGAVTAAVATLVSHGANNADLPLGLGERSQFGMISFPMNLLK